MAQTDRTRTTPSKSGRSTRRAPANSARKTALSRDDIVRASIKHIDRHGLAEFSMRSLAATLDISSPALYWHFAGRDELLAACCAAMLAEVDTDPGDQHEPWQDAVRRVLHSVWTTAERHPALLDILATQPLHTSEGERVLHALLAILRRAGFSPAEAVDHGRVLLWSTFGFIRSSAATQARTGKTGRGVELDLGDVDPNVAVEVAECFPHLRALDVESLFEHALGALISGIGNPPRKRTK